MKQNLFAKTTLDSLRLSVIAILSAVSLTTMADDQKVLVNIGTFDNGTIVEKSQSEPDADGNVTVTITATPAEGYQISKGDIVVKATVAPEYAQTRNGSAIEVGDQLTLEGPDGVQTGATDYTFVVPEGLGAVVESATFEEQPKPEVPNDHGEGIDDGKTYRISFGNGAWYLWPSTTTDADGHPYLTTFNDIKAPALNEDGIAYEAFDENYSIWRLTRVEVGEAVYFQLFNVGLQQYAVWSEASGERAVHMEAEPADIAKTYFRLDGEAPNYLLTPSEAAEGTTLNSHGGDKPYLSATNEQTAPDNDGRYGLIRVYDGNPIWTFTLAEPVEEPKPATSGNLGEEGHEEEVTWALASEADGPLTLTISGTGTARSLAAEEAAPWNASAGDIASVVLDEGITRIGDGLLSACTSVKTIEIKNEETIVALGDNALPTVEGLTADVPGHLYNEYRLTDGWKALTIASTTGIAMSDIAFTEKNDYRTFASSEAVRIPSVLKAYVATSITDNTVNLTEITDGIIPAGVPVLLYTETNDDDIRTSVATADGTATQSVLQVAPAEGLEVALCEVYLLYNDVFYLSQAGTLPAGRVYLPVSALTPGTSQARVALSRGMGDSTGDTTGISEITPPATPLSDAWYSLDGRRLSTAPVQKGVYIHNGKKVVVR